MKALGKAFYIITFLLACSWQAYAESVNDQAKQALNLGRVATASDLLNKQVQSKPDDYQAWFLLGVAQARGKHFHQAIEAFRRVIELRDDLAEPHNNLAVIYNELGDVKAAVSELEQSLQKHPGYAIAEENIADLYVKLALQYYKKALLKNNNAELAQRYARLLQVRDTRGNKKEDVTRVAQVEASKEVAPVVAKPVVSDAKVIPKGMAEKKINHVGQVETLKEVMPKLIDNHSQGVAREQVDNKKAEHADVADHVIKANEADAVLASVEAWRVAWQGQDLDAYFSAYASDYVPTGKYASLAAWKAYKKRVIGNKSYIKVDLSDIKIEFSKDKSVARVRFNQAFHSNSYNGDDVKVLKLEKRHKNWKIVREASVS